MKIMTKKINLKITIEETAETISGLYHISYDNALQDTKEFILLLKQNGCMEGL